MYHAPFTCIVSFNPHNSATRLDIINPRDAEPWTNPGAKGPPRFHSKNPIPIHWPSTCIFLSQYCCDCLVFKQLRKNKLPYILHPLYLMSHRLWKLIDLSTNPSSASSNLYGLGQMTSSNGQYCQPPALL